MKRLAFILLVALSQVAYGTSLLIPMDGAQTNHLKAYGLAYLALKKDVSVDWLLNYRGGSFLIAWSELLERECVVRGIYFEKLSALQVTTLLAEVTNPSVNMDVVRLDQAPHIAVYSPKNEFIPDETDAVINVLDYAEIPYTILYDEEILKDELAHFDWLHLHHEDFTGQASKELFRQEKQFESKMQEIIAAKLGYARVSAMKYDVAKKILAFCSAGHYLFAMCSGAETFDIALAAQGQDIESEMSEGSGVALDYSRSLAFENFELQDGRNFSDINVGGWGNTYSENDFFRLFQFSAKWDVVPSLLTQNHEHVIRDFNGLTTAFNPARVKPEVLVMAENKQKPNVRYIYGEVGKGHFTYYSGHDPEATQGGRGGGQGGPGGGRGMPRKTDLSLYPHSPGYRLILNNVLFPSAHKKRQKT
jgi:hypothetical protein